MKLTTDQLKERLYTPLHMKSKNITHIILEGPNGVGKTSLVPMLMKKSQYRYVIYDRGEISNFVYSNIYGRPFTSLQRNLPFIYIVLTCDKKVLKQRIESRGHDEKDVSQIDEQDLFIEAAKLMKDDFHIIIIDTTNQTIEETANTILQYVDGYRSTIETDEKETQWNEAYRAACKQLGLTFEVRENQPYINNELCMSESTWQNGLYETFSDKKTFPDNLLFSLTYDIVERKQEKTLDFAYVINSKINRRPEVIKYYQAMLNEGFTCLVSDKVYDAFKDDERQSQLQMMDRVFGNDFITELAKAKATVYCARDLEYLKLQTARLYEAILADQIVFVDVQSDLDNEMLRQIHDERLADFLRVTPQTICEKYKQVINDEQLHQQILENQRNWYYRIRNELISEGGFKK